MQPRVNVTLKSEGTEPSHYVIRGYGALINPKWFFRHSAPQTHTSHQNFQRYSPLTAFVGPGQGKCARGHTPMEIFFPLSGEKHISHSMAKHIVVRLAGIITAVTGKMVLKGKKKHINLYKLGHI